MENQYINRHTNRCSKCGRFMKIGVFNTLEHIYYKCKPMKFERQITIYPMGIGAMRELNRIFKEELERLVT